MCEAMCEMELLITDPQGSGPCRLRSRAALSRKRLLMKKVASTRAWISGTLLHNNDSCCTPIHILDHFADFKIVLGYLCIILYVCVQSRIRYNL